MAKINFWKVLLCGFIFAVIAEIIYSVGSFLTMGYYTDPNYLAVWSKIMMPNAGPPPALFFVYSFIFSIIGGVLIALVYAMVESALKQKSVWQKGAMYGLLISLVGVIPGNMVLPLMVNVPWGMATSWAAEGLIINLIAGACIARIMK